MLEAIGITHHEQAFIRGRLLPFFKALSLVFLLGMTIDDFACAQTTTQKHMTSGQCHGNDHNPFSFGNPCRNCTLRICDVSKIDKIPALASTELKSLKHQMGPLLFYILGLFAPQAVHYLNALKGFA